MSILYFNRERAKVVSAALYAAAITRQQELEQIAIVAANNLHEYACAIAALDHAGGAWAINNALDHLAELTPSYPAWR